MNKYSVTIQKDDGEAIIYDIEQDEDEFLGLCFKDDLLKIRRDVYKRQIIPLLGHKVLLVMMFTHSKPYLRPAFNEPFIRFII